MQLLGDAGLTAIPEDDGGLVAMTVPDQDLARARSVVGLVLPELLEPDADAVKLSDRLIRTDSDTAADTRMSGGSGLLDGRFALGERRGPDAADTDRGDLADLDDFVPPAPPAIPRPRDHISRFAWGGVILGPILLMLTALLHLPSLVTAAGLAMFIGGFGTLIARHDEPPRDGWDDGAVV
jgi:hypothetical protein